MIRTLEQIFAQAWQRLGEQIALLLPNLLAMLLILAVGWILARLAQWAVARTSARLENYLRRWGVSAAIGRDAGGATRLCARGVFWILFSGAVLLGVNALNLELSSRLVAGAFLYLPRLLAAGLLLLAGLLLGRFLARSVLIWAVNEGVGQARWIAAGVRIGVVWLAVLAAVEQLAIARAALLATFVILLSAAALAAALAVGLGSRKRFEQWLDQRAAFLHRPEHEERLEHL